MPRSLRSRQAAGAKSLRQIAAALNVRGIATARGGKWEAQTVANVLKRVAVEVGHVSDVNFSFASSLSDFDIGTNCAVGLERASDALN